MTVPIDMLLSPIGVVDFFNNYHGKKPCVIHRSDPSFYSQVFTLEEFEYVIETWQRPKKSNVRISSVGAHADSPKVLETGYVDMAALYESYYRGHSVILEGIEKKTARLDRLRQDFETFYAQHGLPLASHVMMVSFLTPANTQALAPHYDPIDIFVLQLGGEKRWTLYGHPGLLDANGNLAREGGECEPDHPLPLKDDGSFTAHIEHLPKPQMEFTLKQGDLLYLPHGYIHQAESTNEHSFHLSVLIRKPPSWRAVMEQLGKDLFALRRSGQAEHFADGRLTEKGKKQFTEAMQALLNRPDWEQLLDAIKLPQAHRSAPVSKNFHLINQVHDVTATTHLVKRNGLVANVHESTDHVVLDFGECIVKGPLAAAEAFRFAAEHEGEFTPADLPGALTPNSKVLLAKKMLREGFLRQSLVPMAQATP